MREMLSPDMLAVSALASCHSVKGVDLTCQVVGTSSAQLAESSDATLCRASLTTSASLAMCTTSIDRLATQCHRPWLQHWAGSCELPWRARLQQMHRLCLMHKWRMHDMI